MESPSWRGVGPTPSGLEQWPQGTGCGGRLSSAAMNGGCARLATTIAVPNQGRVRMWYAIEGHDGDDVLAQRQAARADHLARLHALREQGRLLLAGPCPAIDAEDPGPAGFSGSIVIAEFPSLDAAREWAQADPYVAAGVYARTDVRPFKPVLP